MFYVFGVELDRKSKTHMYTHRTATANAKDMAAFGNLRKEKGLAAALLEFKKIGFRWVDDDQLSVGDIMASSIFSPRAANAFRTMRANYDIFEAIKIESTDAFYIAPSRIATVSDELDVFRSDGYRNGPVVSERFKQAWEAEGLVGAEFEPITTEPRIYPPFPGDGGRNG